MYKMACVETRLEDKQAKGSIVSKIGVKKKIGASCYRNITPGLPSKSPT
jgi:hypothetical protein